MPTRKISALHDRFSSVFHKLGLNYFRCISSSFTWYSNSNYLSLLLGLDLMISSLITLSGSSLWVIDSAVLMVALFFGRMPAEGGEAAVPWDGNNEKCQLIKSFWLLQNWKRHQQLLEFFRFLHHYVPRKIISRLGYHWRCNARGTGGYARWWGGIQSSDY